MKLLVAVSLLMAFPLANLSSENESNPDLEMQLQMEKVFEEKVKIYDYNGILVKELNISDVATNQISVLDYMLLEGSDFAFDYMGDYYYFQ